MFTLRGVSESGKSSKIRDIAIWILNNYPHATHNINFALGDISGCIEINKLKIGLVAAGDDLECVSINGDLLQKIPDIDILINTSRTKGCTRNYLETNYNRSTGWLRVNIFVTHYSPTNPSLESIRDAQILDELKTWITGLEKI